MSVQREIPIEPNDEKRAPNPVSNHGFHARKTEGKQPDVRRDEGRNSSLDAASVNGLESQTVTRTLLDLRPRHFAQFQKRYGKRGAIGFFTILNIKAVHHVLKRKDRMKFIRSIHITLAWKPDLSSLFKRWLSDSLLRHPQDP